MKLGHYMKIPCVAHFLYFTYSSSYLQSTNHVLVPSCRYCGRRVGPTCSAILDVFAHTGHVQIRSEGPFYVCQHWGLLYCKCHMGSSWPKSTFFSRSSIWLPAVFLFGWCNCPDVSLGLVDHVPYRVLSLSIAFHGSSPRDTRTAISDMSSECDISPLADTLRLMNRGSIPIIVNGTGWIPPASALNYVPWAIVGFISQYLVRRWHFGWWSKYNCTWSQVIRVTSRHWPP